MKNTANYITASRIAISIPLIFLSADMPAFYGVYALGGITDAADGFVARKTHTESDFGARLDSIADLIFIAVCAIKLVPHIKLSLGLYLWIALIAAVKLFNISFGCIRYGRLTMPHTRLNKLTGAMLFIYPLSIMLGCTEAAAIPLCLTATAAAIHEMTVIYRGEV